MSEQHASGGAPQYRWFHRPHLHVPSPHRHRRVGWLELFYDLIYVATIIQLGNALSHNMKLEGFLAFAALFAPIWLTWTSFTLYSNRFVVDDAVHRGMVFIQMFAVGGMAVHVHHIIEGDFKTFVLFYALARFVLVALYFRSWHQVAQAKEMSLRYMVSFAVGASLWTLSAFMPTPWVYLVWAVALGIDFSVGLSRQSRTLQQRFQPDVLHMTERYGLLTIIVLGESFVKVLTEVADKGGSFDLVLMAGLALAVTVSLWWIYFDDVAGSRIKQGQLSPFVWIYSHLPLTIAITAVGVAVKKAVFFEMGVVAPAKYRWMLCGTLALALIAVGCIDAVTERRQAQLSDAARVRARFIAAFLVLMLAPLGDFMPGWAFLTMIALACIAQVIFDLSMAPMAEDPEAAHNEFRTLFEPVVDADDIDDEQQIAPPPKRFDVSEAVRRGTPSELRRDLYFHLMEGSWLRFFVTVCAAYVFINTVFAGLYLVDPGGVQNMDANSFAEAFFFSVQTISTIGYGVLAPVTGYANLVMTLEAGTGLLLVALVTGLMFAKASRPHSSMLFSKVAVINSRGGKPTLGFRVGNARGNDVVEATMRVTVLKSEVSPEGHTLRKLHDLELMRDRTPLFSLSWSIIHEIDESSPLYGITQQNMEEKLFVIIVTMTGHDSTYAQTTHGRTMYYPEHIRWNQRFVDVISSLNDGRMVIDYDKFHDTLPMDAEHHIA